MLFVSLQEVSEWRRLKTSRRGILCGGGALSSSGLLQAHDELELAEWKVLLKQLNGNQHENVFKKQLFRQKNYIFPTQFRFCWQNVFSALSVFNHEPDLVLILCLIYI